MGDDGMVFVLPGVALLRSAAVDGGSALNDWVTWVTAGLALLLGLLLCELHHRRKARRQAPARR